MNIQLSQPGLDGADQPLPVQRHPQVTKLLAHGQPTPAAVDDFLADHEFPLVEPGAATFAWRGAADHVDILRWIHAGGDRTRFERVTGTELWLLRLPVTDGGRFEYKLAIGRHGSEDWILESLVETAIGRYKAIIGGRLRARSFGVQQTEVAFGCTVLNRMLACARP